MPLIINKKTIEEDSVITLAELESFVTSLINLGIDADTAYIDITPGNITVTWEE
jgi:hypothetical protein